jgi:diguanylate cyclase (GGDEF)-like protein
MLSQAPSPARVTSGQNGALTCYLSAMLAMAKSMRAICSRAGLVYGDRLMRLPRRLGFDATPAKLEESCQVLETDLAEYTEATTAWLDTGFNLAREILAITSALDPCTDEGQNLHAAMLEDLAQQMAVSAELDTDADLRAALKRYAMGLRSYLQRRQLESQCSLSDLQSRADQLAKWLTRADPSHSTDLMTGLPNRAEFERQLEACWQTLRPVSALLFEWKQAHTATTPGAAQAIAKQLADRLADLVRPRDIIGRWGPNQFAVIFECSGGEAIKRATGIAEWLTGDYPAEVQGAVAAVQVSVTVSVIERLPEETLAQLVQRIEQLEPAPHPTEGAA